MNKAMTDKKNEKAVSAKPVSRKAWAGMAAGCGVGIAASSFVPGLGMLSPLFKNAALMALGGADARSIEERRLIKAQVQNLVQSARDEFKSQNIPAKPVSALTDSDRAYLSLLTDEQIGILRPGHKVEAFRAQILLDLGRAREGHVAVPQSVAESLRVDKKAPMTARYAERLRHERGVLHAAFDMAEILADKPKEKRRAFFKDWRDVLRLGAIQALEVAMRHVLKGKYKHLASVFAVAESAEVIRDSVRLWREKSPEDHGSVQSMIDSLAARIGQESRVLSVQAQKDPRGRNPSPGSL